jgi:hypothetical protein
LHSTKRSTLGRGCTAWLGAQLLHSVTRARLRESVKERGPRLGRGRRSVQVNFPIPVTAAERQMYLRYLTTVFGGP